MMQTWANRRILWCDMDNVRTLAPGCKPTPGRVGLKNLNLNQKLIYEAWLILFEESPERIRVLKNKGAPVPEKALDNTEACQLVIDTTKVIEDRENRAKLVKILDAVQPREISGWDGWPLGEP